MRADEETRLRESLQSLPPGERAAWIDEVERLARLVTEYEAITPKRRFNQSLNAYEFTPDILALCR